MGSLDFNFLRQLQDDFFKYPIFIETGTKHGVTTFSMEPYFKHLITIELSEKYHNFAKSKYSGSKINFILGDSADVFEKILDSVEENAIFFLDGHWSSGDTAKGPKDCPLVEEIAHINNHYKHEAIIIVDDFRLFGKGPQNGCNEDWSDIHKDTLLKILDKRIEKVYHLDSEYAKNDRLIIHINNL
jgi:hypothetical protein